MGTYYVRPSFEDEDRRQKGEMYTFICFLGCFGVFLVFFGVSVLVCGISVSDD